MPQRLQRKRTKGYRLPPGAVYVGRGTPWGNPFVVGAPCGVFPEGMGFRGQAETLIASLTLDQAIEFYRNLVMGYICPEMYPFGHSWQHTFLTKFRNLHPTSAARSYLRGKDLACWCSLSGACHADILLELANAP